MICNELKGQGLKAKGPADSLTDGPTYKRRRCLIETRDPASNERRSSLWHFDDFDFFSREDSVNYPGVMKLSVSKFTRGQKKEKLFFRELN